MTWFCFVIFVFALPCLVSLEYEQLFFPRESFNYLTLATEQSPRINPLKCETDEECQILIEGSICENQYCKCATDKLLSSDRSKCLNPATGYGYKCEENIQCSHTLSSGGVCISNECKCKQGYHYLKGFCWKNHGLNSHCRQHEQCFSDHEYIGLECKSDICKCRSNYYQRHDTGCRRKKRTGEKCNLDADCVDNTICESMTCLKVLNEEETFQKNNYTSENYNYSSTNMTPSEAKGFINCPKGTFEWENKCVLELGMKCDNDANCSHIGKALCLDNAICGCEPPLFVASENNRQCLQVTRAKIDDLTKSYCRENVQCGVFGENSICQDKKCRCKEGSYWENDSKYCWIHKSLGEKCLDDRDCYPSAMHTKCVRSTNEQICACQDGYHSNGTHCIPNALKVGDYCDVDDDCLFDYSYCDKNFNTCSCKKYHYVDNYKCVPGVESFCKKDADCIHLKNTNCRKGNLTEMQCLCLNDNIKSNDIKYCLPVKKHQEKCEESFQCKANLGELGECIKGICQCNETAHYSEAKCYKSKFVSDQCSNKLECFPGNDTNSVICLKGYCACHYDYILAENGLCVKANSANLSRSGFLFLVTLIACSFSIK